MQFPILFGFVPQWASTWLTPIWLLGAGAVLALLVMVVFWGLLFLVAPKGAKAIPLAVREGPLFPLFVTTLLLAGFGIFGIVVVRKPADLFNSLAQLPSAGTRTQAVSIKAAPKGVAVDPAKSKPQRIDFKLQRDELRRLLLTSKVNLVVSAYDELLTASTPRFDVSGGETFTWERGQGVNPWPAQAIDGLYVWNFDDQPTTLNLQFVVAPVYGEVIAIPVMALFIIGVFGVYMLIRAGLPKISAVALATAKSEMAQPLFMICMVLGFFALTCFVVLPYNTFGEDIKMLKDSSLTTIMILAIITCLWGASSSVADEIEGRTALTVLSKPLSRRQFILGKFTGIVWVAVVMFCLLGLWFLITVAYKPIYDARETANVDPTWRITFSEMAQSTPGLALGFFETVVLAAVSVAISTRLPLLANFIICSSIYALGHLTPLLVKSSIGAFEPVVFVARLIATVLPVLEHFDIKPAIAGGRIVPLEYMASSLIYCILYSTVAMLLALALFEDRDLA